MSVKTRALIIGLTGPAIQAVGIVWAVSHLLLVHWHDSLTARHIVFESPFLFLFVGFLVSLVCIPVALEVARATPEEVELPVLDPASDEPAGFELQPRASEGK
jgi:hypothetical protein